MVIFRKKKYYLLLTAILFLGGSPLFGQITANPIQGIVVDDRQEPISGATIELVGQGEIRLTDKNGVFRFDVPSGDYMLDISMMGYERKSTHAQFDRDSVPIFTLMEKTYELGEIVLTATRTEKKIKDIPLPVNIVGKDEIRKKGMVRLDEVLAEQPGIILVEDHGTGIQLQGFEPKYTMILIDGEPVIGRTSGTLELSRITMANVERVEILKGPSSSLYGSEAMAGVVNIITEKPAKGERVVTSVRYGTHNALDLSVNGSIAGERSSISGTFNRISNSGYNYGGSKGSKTVPPFYGYTGNVRGTHQLTSKINVRLGINYNDEHARDEYITDTGTENQEVISRFLRKDMMITPAITYRHSNKHNTDLRFNQSFFKTDTHITTAEDGTLYNHDYYDQNLSKAELQHDYKIHKSVQLTAGAGIVDERLKAVRYEDKKEFRAGFGYTQVDVKITDRMNFIAGGRFDTHNVYASQFSPKFAGQYKILPWLTLQGTVGSAFKAPDFRELYLNWTNPTEGYSVFGAEDAKNRLNELVEVGEIADVMFDPTKIKALDAERSWNYQAGIKLEPARGLTAGVNLFRNQVKNLIETFMIATKKNGKPVYTYTNQENVLIEGAEADIAYKLGSLDVKTGIQYLNTANKDVLDAIKAGKEYYTRDAETGSSRPVKRSEYGGLFNRSRYTTNTSVSYTWKEPQLYLSFRWAYRSQFGVRDIDGNGILNLKKEYSPGYSLFNASAVKSFFDDRLSLSLSMENIGNMTDTGIATLPGRQVFVGVNYTIK